MFELILSDCLTSRPVTDALKKNYRRGTRHLVIVPDRFTLSYERAILRELSLKGTFDIEVASFSRLADNAMESEGTGCLDSLSEVMLLRKVIERNRDKLKCFAGSAARAGFCSEMYAVLSQVRASGVSLAALKEAAVKLKGKTALKTEDIVLLYGEYMAALGGMEDNQSKLEVLLERVKEGSWRDAHVYISDFTGFTAVEEDIVSALAQNSLSLTMCLPADRSAPNAGIYPLGTLARLTQAAKEAGIKTEVRECRLLKGDLAVLGANLFGYGGKKFTSDGSVFLFGSPTAESEIRWVARQIKGAVTDKGRRYRDFAVVCCDRTEYVGVVDKVFADFGIPVYFDSKSPLAATAGARLLQSGINAVLYGKNRRDVLEFVKCPLTGVAADDADAFENYILHAGADRSAFDRPFEIELEDMAQAESVRARLMRLLAPLAVFGRTRAAAEEYSKAVTDFFNGCDFVKNNAALVSRLQESDPAQAMVNDQSVAELASIVTAAEEVFGEDKISPKVYAEVLSSAIEARQVSTVPLSLDCVYVGQVGESRYENCKYMFVVGASLGKLPAESADTGLLSDSDCAEWGRFDAPVHPNARERGLRYKLSALMTLLKSEKKLYVSYCTSDKAGNKTQPSAAMNEIASLLGLKINFFREMPEAIVSRAALARYLGGAGNAKGALISFVGLKRDNIDVLSREDLNALYSYVSEKFGAEYVRNLTEGKRLPFDGGDLSAEVFSGGHASASALERYAACPFLYFMDYVIKAKEREEARLNARDTGTLLHAVLEKFFGDNKQSESWEEGLREKVRSAFDEMLNGEEFSYLKSLPGMRSELDRLFERAVFIIDSLTEKMKAGSFRPDATEVRFGFEDGGIPAVTVSAAGRTIKLRGVIDRVDRWGDHVLVVDYKSKKASSLDFSPIKVAKGERIQTFLYLIALLASDKKLKPAGVFYLPLGNDYVSGKDAEGRYRYTGFVSSEPEVAKALDPGGTGALYPCKKTAKGLKATKGGTLLSEKGFYKYCEYVLKSISRSLEEMKDGFIMPSPASENICKYCAFKNVCASAGENVREEKYEDPHIAGEAEDGVE